MDFRMFRVTNLQEVSSIKLPNWKVNKDGDLVWVRDKYGRNKSYYIIAKERLDECDWISHMNGKMEPSEFGEFVCAYLTACEMAGIKELNIRIYGFNGVYEFTDKT